MNLIPVIREALGLQEHEEFNLIKPQRSVISRAFRFTSNSLQIHYPQGWEEAHDMTLRALLRGDLKVAKLPFKPKTGEDYYFVDVSLGYVCRTTYGLGYRHDVVRIREALRVSSGNCYQTEEEAEKHIDEWMEKLYGEDWRNLYEPDTDD